MLLKKFSKEYRKLKVHVIYAKVPYLKIKNITVIQNKQTTLKFAMKRKMRKIRILSKMERS